MGVKAHLSYDELVRSQTTRNEAEVEREELHDGHPRPEREHSAHALQCDVCSGRESESLVQLSIIGLVTVPHSRLHEQQGTGRADQGRLGARSRNTTTPE